MDRSTRLAIATGISLTVGALFFILLGDGIIYFANIFSAPSGAALGSSLADIGYGIIALLIIAFVLVVGYLVYRFNQGNSSEWSGL